MRLQRGWIAYFKYTRHHKDPYPLALILYVGDKLVHCLNIHYLSDYLTDDLIDTIAKVALRKISPKDMYEFYHGHLKQKLPEIVKSAYRTYKPQSIANIVVVSKGFEMSRGFIEQLKPKPSEEKIKATIKKEITKVQQSDKVPEDYASELPSAKITKGVEDYFNQIKSIVKKRIDKSKFTGYTK